MAAIAMNVTRRTFLFWLSALVCWVRRRPRPIELKATSATTCSSVAGINSNGANFLVCMSNDPLYTPEDSECNTWTRVDTDPRVSLHYSVEPKTARKHTFYSPKEAGSVLQVGAYSGVQCIDGNPAGIPSSIVG